MVEIILKYISYIFILKNPIIYLLLIFLNYFIIIIEIEHESLNSFHQVFMQLHQQATHTKIATIRMP
jgi:hypothetical protein